MGGLTAVAVKVALANPGSHQHGERLFLKMDQLGQLVAGANRAAEAQGRGGGAEGGIV